MSRAGRPPPGRQLRERLRTARSRSLSSQRWLERQLNDPYVAAARQQGYRSRAAWKLQQMDDRHRLVPQGGRVVDLGAAPGGWTQVVLERAGPGGRVLAVDINEMEPLAGAEVMQLDFTAEGADEIVKARLDGPVDLVLSDMAQPATGHRQTDHIRIMLLCEMALDFALDVLKPGGAFVAKVLKGGTENELLRRMKRHFTTVRHAKPDASRKDSAEAYVIATGFKG